MHKLAPDTLKKPWVQFVKPDAPEETGLELIDAYLPAIA
jgi:hypothetical protein